MTSRSAATATSKAPDPCTCPRRCSCLTATTRPSPVASSWLDRSRSRMATSRSTTTRTRPRSRSSRVSPSRPKLVLNEGPPKGGPFFLEAELLLEQARRQRARAEQPIVKQPHPPPGGACLVAEGEDRRAAERVARRLQRGERVAAHLRDRVRLLEARPLDHEPPR